jgi:hypothetical protein
MLLFMQNYLNTCHCCRSVLKLYINDRRDSNHIAVVYTSNAAYGSFLIVYENRNPGLMSSEIIDLRKLCRLGFWDESRLTHSHTKYYI